MEKNRMTIILLIALWFYPPYSGKSNTQEDINRPGSYNFPKKDIRKDSSILLLNEIIDAGETLERSNTILENTQKELKQLTNE